MRRAALLVAMMGTLGAPAGADTPTTATVRRFLVSVGANRGRADRVPLRYAISDAQRVARVLTTMGGVDPADAIVLEDPDVRRLRGVLDGLAARIPPTSARGRTEVLVYYSGHADEHGLLLGHESFAYQSIRDALARLPSDLNIAILDACSSGAITRLKGGKWQQPFLVDASSDMRGYAFLTSSSENEAAQESDLLKSSFFTHFLLSGLRGAADATGDGRVTLNEAYQFAFGETLARTTRTQGGSQHPAYDMRLAGTGDVVMTELRRTTAGLTLNEGLGGRFFVRDSDRHLVAEVFKPEGRAVELGLEPGAYVIELETAPELLTASVRLGEGDRRVVGRDLFRVTGRDAAVRRGPAPEAEGLPAVPDRRPFRSRVSLDLGIFRTSGADGAAVFTSNPSRDSVRGLSSSVAYEYGVDGRLSIGILSGAHVLDVAVEKVGSETRTNAAVVVPMLFRARYHFLDDARGSRVRPYVHAGMGPYLSVITKRDLDQKETTRVTAVFGGRVGGGVDLAASRHFSAALDVAYDRIGRLSEPLSGKRNVSGFSVSLSFGLSLGPRAPRSER